MSINYKEKFIYLDGFLFHISTGEKAGWKNGHGYWQVYCDKKYLRMQRVIWEMFNGPIPIGLEIDHVDRNKDNNRIENLRLTTRSENALNRNVQSNNKLGIKGVSKSGKKFVAYTRVNKKTINLGYYNTPEEASKAYEDFHNDVH